MMPTGDVFVSYSHPDKECALALVAALEARGLGVWVAPRDVSPGADWAAEIVDAIARARLMVLVFSAHCNDSPQVRREVERAVHRQLPILPFRIAEVLPTKSLEYFLSAQHWFDAFPAPREPFYRRIALHAEQLLGRHSQSSATPAPGRVAPLALDDERRRSIERQLALQVGPIARVLLERAATVALHERDLIERLAREVETDRGRREFVAACGAIASQ